MAGTTFVYEPDITRLALLVSDLDSIEDFPHVHMEVMLTVDFTQLCMPKRVKWSAGDPVHFDDDSGLAIFAVSPQGLDLVLGQGSQPTDDRSADMKRLKTFLEEYGTNHIYEVSTF